MTAFQNLLEVEYELDRYPILDDVTVLERGRGLILSGSWSGRRLRDMRLIRWKSGEWSLSVPVGRGRWSRIGYFGTIQEAFHLLFEDPSQLLLGLVT